MRSGTIRRIRGSFLRQGGNVSRTRALRQRLLPAKNGHAGSAPQGVIRAYESDSSSKSPASSVAFVSQGSHERMHPCKPGFSAETVCDSPAKRQQPGPWVVRKGETAPTSVWSDVARPLSREKTVRIQPSLALTAPEPGRRCQLLGRRAGGILLATPALARGEEPRVCLLGTPQEAKPPAGHNQCTPPRGLRSCRDSAPAPPIFAPTRVSGARMLPDRRPTDSAKKEEKTATNPLREV
jgi:hypothetical protein